jgi:ADP-heptose:LPS heptosyltransferase/tetratricopeptide (TPR) repeat protein
MSETHIPPHIAATAPRHILWVRPDSIGDNVLASAMLPHLRAAFPVAKISVFCQQHIAELYQACPYVNDVVTFEPARCAEESYRVAMLRGLQGLGVDLCLNSVYSRSGITDFAAYASQAPERVAFFGGLENMSAEAREQNNRVYTRLIPSDPPHLPELERHRAFLRGLGIDAPSLLPQIWTTAEDERVADELFQASGLDPQRTIALFAGAQVDVRIYQHYGAAIARLCREQSFSVIALGAPQDADINKSNLLECHPDKALDLTGKTTLRQSAALLRRCRLALGAETGLAHIACAVGTPNVILLGGGHFGRFMPYAATTSAVSVPLECHGCNWQCRFSTVHCVKDVDPRLIEAAVRRTLGSPAARPRVFVPARLPPAPAAAASSPRPALRWPETLTPRAAVEIIQVELDVPVTLAKERSGSLSVARGKSHDNIIAEPRGEDAMSLLEEEYVRSIELVKQGKVPEAIAMLEALLVDESFCALVRNDLGAIHYQQGRKQEALQHFERAVRMDPTHVNAHKNLADVYVDVGRREEAVQMLKHVVAMDPADTEARQQLEKLGATAPRSAAVDQPESMYRKAHELLAAGKTDEAGATLGAVLRMNPDHDRAHNDLAVLHYQNGKTVGNLALHHLMQAVQSEPKYGQAWENLAEICKDQGRMEEAAEVQRILASIEQGTRYVPPVSNDPSYLQAEALAKAGQTDAATTALLELVKKNPQHAPAHNDLGILHYHQYKAMQEMAVSHLREAVRRNPRQSEVWKNLARICVDRRRPEEAAEIYQTILGYDPSDEEAKDQLRLLRVTPPRPSPRGQNGARV